MKQDQIEQIIKEVMVSLGSSDGTDYKKSTFKNSKSTNGQKVTQKDYPLSTNRPELLKGQTGKMMDDITLERVLNGDIKPDDVRISPETLELQAQIADSVGRKPFANNLRRAAELISVPDDRILEIYNALRPKRSSKQDLLNIAAELENKFGANISAEFVREAAEVYEKREQLKTD
ncbi:diol dehydratase small subunit [Salipaludibacillus daqingensis]|uniref:diol dehydratase small subunit n=1 Tax=Salipaludibacillus daqingensis TaxID=3041001 RepID=UPI002474167B|nr:diol dehydratase small subunit [Salipaludibacillus daqingensis]